MNSSRLELRDQVGQLLIMGFEGPEMTDRLRSVMNQLQPAGVILFTRNIQSASQTHALLREARRTTIAPMFTCVDLEGGTVDRMREVTGPTPSAFEVGCTHSKKLFRRFGQLLGTEARAFGFNVDFAPVSDLGKEASRSVLGSRTVSAEANDTIIFVQEFLAGLGTAGVLGCGKHFPGLGEAALDTHFDLAPIDKPWKALWREDLAPYRKLRKVFPFVMVAHAAYPKVTGVTPASLSKQWMTGVLRKKIGYDGIVLSDDLEMGAVAAGAGSIGEAAVQSISAGADVFLVCHHEENVVAAYEAVLREAERSRKFARRVREACARVLSAKKRYRKQLQPPPAPSDKQMAGLKRARAEFRETISKAARQL